LWIRSQKKAQKNGEPTVYYLLHDNAPAHRLVFVKDFLAKNNVTMLEHPPYSPDLAVVDSYLFPRLKSALKGQRCCVATDIIKNATEELKRLSQNGFQECFQHLYSYCHKCIVAQGDYCEGNIT
jgi:transposase